MSHPTEFQGHLWGETPRRDSLRESLLDRGIDCDKVVHSIEPNDPPQNGIQLKEEGIHKVSEHNENWLEDCVKQAEVIGEGVLATGEDIRFWCEATVGHPKHHNAWGALINTLLKRKIIVPTGEWRPMKDRASHARKTPVYKRA